MDTNADDSRKRKLEEEQVDEEEEEEIPRKCKKSIHDGLCRNCRRVLVDSVEPRENASWRVECDVCVISGLSRVDGVCELCGAIWNSISLNQCDSCLMIACDECNQETIDNDGAIVECQITKYGCNARYCETCWKDQKDGADFWCDNCIAQEDSWENALAEMEDRNDDLIDRHHV